MSYCFNSYFGLNMHKIRSYYWKIAKIAQCWLPDPQLQAAGGGATSHTPIENSWLRHWTAPSRTEGRGLRQGEHFADMERGSMFVILRRRLYGWTLIYFFRSCVANSPVCKGVSRKFSRESNGKVKIEKLHQ